MSRPRPRIGEQGTDHAPICRWAPAAGAPPCGARAAVHVLLEDPNRPPGIAMLQACKVHAEVARLAGPLLAEHPFQGWCGVARSYWDRPRNVCDLDDPGSRP